MTQDEIIELGVQAGIIPWTKHEYIGGNKFSASDEGLDGDRTSLIQFAKLIAEKEREACAKVCDEQQEFVGGEMCCVAMNCATNIRARGQA